MKFLLLSRPLMLCTTTCHTRKKRKRNIADSVKWGLNYGGHYRGPFTCCDDNVPVRVLFCPLLPCGNKPAHSFHSQIFFFLHKTGERSLCIPHAYNPAFIGGCVGSKAGQEVVEKRKKYTFGNYQVNTGLLHAFRN